MNWHAQFEAWQEIVWGLVLLFAGLGLEFAIDVWRERVLKGRTDADQQDVSGTDQESAEGQGENQMSKGKGGKTGSYGKGGKRGC